MEFRVLGTDLSCIENTRKIGGYINVTERESEILYNKNKGKWFKETMKKGVFERALDRANDIPLLLQHDWDKKLASTSNKTLNLREDQVGLRFEAEIEDEKLYSEIRDGKINHCSFGFSVVTEQIEPINNRLEKRSVEEINLYEVSLVKNPAYEGSIVEARQYEQALKMDEETLLHSSEDNTVTITVKNDEEIRKVDSEENEELKKDENKDEVSSKDEKAKNSDDESKEDDDTSLESEVSENSEDSKEKESEETKEDSEDKESEETKDDSKEKESEKTKDDSENKEDKPKEKRNEGLDEGNQFENIASSPTELKSLINELIDSKLLDIEKAKTNEQIAQEELETVKCINSLIEEDCESIHIEKMNELIKLEIELLKLKEIKGRIQ